MNHNAVHLIPPCDCRVQNSVMIRGKPYLVCSACGTRTPKELEPVKPPRSIERELAMTLAAIALVILAALISGCVVGAVS
jgi:hypothetical protein